MNGRPVSMILLSTRTYDVISGEYAGLYEMYTATMRPDGHHEFHATIHEISEVCCVSLSAVTLPELVGRESHILDNKRRMFEDRLLSVYVRTTHLRSYPLALEYAWCPTFVIIESALESFDIPPMVKCSVIVFWQLTLLLR